VDYEVLPGRATPLEAYENPAPRIHEYGEEGNVHKRVSFHFGDTDEGFAEADRVFEDVFFFQGNTHLPIEQHATVASPDPDGKLVVWSSTQVPHYLHRALSRALAMPAAHIRVIATPNGGGFGVKNDGSITSMHLKTFIDGGAYGSYGVASTFYTGALQTVTYRIPRYRFEACRMFTNKPPCGPKRGHGTPQPRFGQEVQLDKIAEALGIDPAGLRLKIVEKPDTTTANYMHVTT